jgi:hypothetical protein
MSKNQRESRWHATLDIFLYKVSRRATSVILSDGNREEVEDLIRYDWWLDWCRSQEFPPSGMVVRDI